VAYGEAQDYTYCYLAMNRKHGQFQTGQNINIGVPLGRLVKNGKTYQLYREANQYDEDAGSDSESEDDNSDYEDAKSDFEDVNTNPEGANSDSEDAESDDENGISVGVQVVARMESIL